VPLDSVVARLRAAGCVFAEQEADLLTEAASTPGELDDLVARRVSGLPLEQILGWAEFAGRRITIDPGVFVPRRRTEFLADHAIAVLRARAAGPETSRIMNAPQIADATAAGCANNGRAVAVVADVCCGSGAIGAAVQAAQPSIELYATDIDPAAVACAAKNIAGQVFQGDLLSPLPHRLLGRLDVIVANVPYVPTDALLLLPPEARDHEPRSSLDGGRDGLDVLRRLAAMAPAWLAPAGKMLVEAGEDQAATAAAIMANVGLGVRTVVSDEWGTTVVIGVAVG
jgi:release factor glutamine methyltransferase